MERNDPLTGKTWMFAIIGEYWTGSDPSVSTFSYSVWMREGSPTAAMTSNVIQSRADGWFQATNEAICARSRWMRETRREEFKLIALAKQRGFHLLRCSECKELSDLEASGWRLSLDDHGSTTAFCPRCSG